jgi:hypothetical protein
MRYPGLVLKPALLMVFVFQINGLCAAQDSHEQKDKQKKNQFACISAAELFGSFYQKQSIGIGYDFMIPLPHRDYPMSEFLINCSIMYESVGLSQFRFFTAIDYSFVFEAGVSYLLQITSQEEVIHGVAPEIKLRLPMILPKFFGNCFGLAYRYNIYPSKMEYNYHDISLSLFWILPFLSTFD